LLAKTFVTVVTLLASSRVLVDADSRQAYARLPVRGPAPMTIRLALVIKGDFPAVSAG
jgi:hypothetical protein